MKLLDGIGPRLDPMLVVLSGPSGVGKDAVLARLVAVQPSCHFVVTATTRTKRPGEKEGKNHFFLKRGAFNGMIDRGEFLEWAEVYGNLYGVPRDQVERALTNGLDVFVRTDVQGAGTIKELIPQAVFICLASPSVDELERRLESRQTEPQEEIQRRLMVAKREMEMLHLFDYIVVNHNGKLDETVATIRSILAAERCRVTQRRIEL